MDQKLLAAITDEVMASMKLEELHRATVLRYTRRTVAQVLTRCNRKDMPVALQVITSEMVTDMLHADAAVPLPEADKEISSITRGDTSIHYRDKASAYERVQGFVKNYDSFLRSFTKPKIPRRAK